MNLKIKINKNYINIKKLFIILTTLIIMLLACLTEYHNLFIVDASTADRSIVGDFFYKVFEIELTDGSNFLESNSDRKYRERLNYKLYKDKVKNDEVYSLYDRFGGDIRFIPYFGEIKITTGLLDHLYTELIVNGDDFELTIDQIKELLSNDNASISNNNVYEGRADVLKSKKVSNGYVDPRVYAFNDSYSTGGSANLGNLCLSFAKFNTNLVSWLASGKIFSMMNTLWTKIMNKGVKSVMRTIANIFLPLSLTCLIAVMFYRTFRVIKGNFEQSFRKMVQDALSMLLSLGLIYTLLANPLIFSDISEKAVTVVDDILDESLQEGQDEVVLSSNTKNTRAAYLWKIAILEPWCEGMFGTKYENLYTQFDEDKKHKKMKQSHDDVTGTWPDNEIKYNSKDITGDVTVKVGKDNYVRNWAALAWSCQSIYHFNSILEVKTSTNNSSTNNNSLNKIEKAQSAYIWPVADLTPNNDQIYIDNFRWIDAKLNISPEYLTKDNIKMNYTNSELYEVSFISNGLRALYLSLLLIPIGVLSLRKLKYSFLIILAGIRLCYYSILNFVMYKNYSVVQNFKKLIRPIYDYFWWSLILFFAIILYGLLMNKSLLCDIVWLGMSVYLNKFRPIRTPEQLRKIAKKVKDKASQTGSNIKQGISNKISKAKNK